MIKIFVDELYWNGKKLRFTWHAAREFDNIRKPFDFALYILNHGEHRLVSKRQNKYNVLCRYGSGHICLSYVMLNDIIIIHVKPKK